MFGVTRRHAGSRAGWIAAAVAVLLLAVLVPARPLHGQPQTPPSGEQWPPCNPATGPAHVPDEPVREDYCVDLLTIDGDDVLRGTEWSMNVYYLPGDQELVGWYLQEQVGESAWSTPNQGTETQQVKVRIKMGSVEPQLSYGYGGSGPDGPFRLYTGGSAQAGYWIEAHGYPVRLEWLSFEPNACKSDGQCGDHTTAAATEQTMFGGASQTLTLWDDGDLYDGMWFFTNAEHHGMPQFVPAEDPYWYVRVGNPHLRIDGVTPVQGSFIARVPPGLLAGVGTTAEQAAQVGLAGRRIDQIDGEDVITPIDVETDLSTDIDGTPDEGVWLELPDLTFSTPQLEFGAPQAALPPAPTGVTASVDRLGALTVTWTMDDPAGVAEYTIDVCAADKSCPEQAIDFTTAFEPARETIFSPGSFPAGRYVASVRSSNEAGMSPAALTEPFTLPEFERVARLAGKDRFATAVAISKHSFPEDGTAAAAVLARSSDFADALAGTPLAVAKDGPLLLTPTATLAEATRDELIRALPARATVYLLGGRAAISPAVEAEVQRMGFRTQRLGGADRYVTATLIAEQMGAFAGPAYLATGTNFPDALGAGAAAAATDGVVLLTRDATLPPATKAFLDARPANERVAVGGQAAAAVPDAVAAAGKNRYETAVLLARRLDHSIMAVGIASGTAFPDGLAGGAHIGAVNGPLVLVQPTALPAEVRDYLGEHGVHGFVYGGSSAVAPSVLDQVEALFVRG
jgi:hypothetical protein